MNYIARRKIKVLCSSCNRDINAIGQDNVSHIPGMPLCEDCAGSSGDYDSYPDEEYEEEDIEE
jgi:hypothetical protein